MNEKEAFFLLFVLILGFLISSCAGDSGESEGGDGNAAISKESGLVFWETSSVTIAMRPRKISIQT